MLDHVKPPVNVTVHRVVAPTLAPTAPPVVAPSIQAEVDSNFEYKHAALIASDGAVNVAYDMPFNIHVSAHASAEAVPSAEAVQKLRVQKLEQVVCSKAGVVIESFAIPTCDEKDESTLAGFSGADDGMGSAPELTVGCLRFATERNLRNMALKKARANALVAFGIVEADDPRLTSMTAGQLGKLLIIELIIARQSSTAAIGVADAGADGSAALAALRADLEALKVPALVRRAHDVGVDEKLLADCAVDVAKTDVTSKKNKVDDSLCGYRWKKTATGLIIQVVGSENRRAISWNSEGAIAEARRLHPECRVDKSSDMAVRLRVTLVSTIHDTVLCRNKRRVEEPADAVTATKRTRSCDQADAHAIEVERLRAENAALHDEVASLKAKLERSKLCS